MTLFVQILIGVAALAFGIYLGMPGKPPGRPPGRPEREERPVEGRWSDTQSAEGRVGQHSEKHLAELERALGNEWGQSRKARRHFTMLGWLRKDERASRRRRATGRFRTAAPSRRGRIGRR